MHNLGNKITYGYVAVGWGDKERHSRGGWLCRWVSDWIYIFCIRIVLFLLPYCVRLARYCCMCL